MVVKFIKLTGASIFLFFIFAFALVRSILAQVVINEFSYGDSNDWIELYSPENIDISGYVIDDLNSSGEPTSTNVYVIPDGTWIGPSTSPFYLIDTDKVKDRLNNTGDEVMLYSSNGTTLTLVDSIKYGNRGGVCIPSNSGTIGRLWQEGVEGTNLIEHFSNSTKGYSNKDNILDPCPTPTPKATNTPTPTSTPVPTKTPTPTKLPTLTTKPTNSPTENQKPTVLSQETNLEEDEDQSSSDSDNNSETDKDVVLGYANSTNGKDIEENAKEEKNRNIPKAAIAIIISGIAFLIVAAYPFLRIRFKKGKDNGENSKEQSVN